MTLAKLDETLAAFGSRPYLTSHVGTMLRDPGGGVEDVQEMANAGMEWLVLNVSDHDPSAWGLVRQRAAAAGVHCMPKGRLANSGDSAADAMRVLRLICETAQRWGTNRAVINVEAEIRDGLITCEQVADVMAEYDVGEAAISSEANLYWSIDWSPLHDYAVLLQMYPEDGKMPPPVTPEKVAAWVKECVTGARERAGFTYVGATYQGWRSDPDWFDRSHSAWSVAYGDDVGAGNWWRWA